MDISLLLVYQDKATNNNISNNRITYKRDYYRELLKCIYSWRLNGGIYKDIPIRIFSDVNINIDGCENIVMNFNSKYKSKYGFINVHLAGLKAHEMFKNCRFIHIDLDMYLQRELPRDIVETEKTVLGVYSQSDEPHQRKKIFSDKLIETDFIASSDNLFYSEYFKYYNFIKQKLKNEDDYDVEEYVADYLYSRHKFKIFEDYEVGEGFYNDVANPYFIHEHIKGT